MRPQAIALECPVPTFHFAVTLRVVGARPDMSHAAEADELVEVAGDELRAVVGDHSGMSVGEFFPRSLEDHLHVGLAHRFAEFPVDEKPARAIQDAGEVVERTADVDVTDVHVPMLVGR